MRDRTWTISNLLSLTRILLVVPIALLLLSDKESHRWWALGGMVIATLTDTLDGYLARALHQETDLGRILDPLADKIAVAAIAGLLMIRGVLPVWFVLGAVGRDVVILFGGLYLKRKKQVIPQSNALGKWTVTVIAVLIMVSAMNDAALSDVKIVLLIVSSVMLCASFSLYAQRFFRIMSSG